jgi:adenylate cyclase
MPQEIERKFLVRKEIWHALIKPAGTLIRQGYLSTGSGLAVRVRTYGGKGFITIKGNHSGITRDEFEYEIPLQDAEEMLRKFTPPMTAKIRYRVPFEGHTWEVDEFLEGNEGLIVAEIELGNADEGFGIPEWIGEEVSLDPKYLNASLALRPFTSWD